jgi:4-carboxymuconolactone decarboxylase
MRVLFTAALSAVVLLGQDTAKLPPDVDPQSYSRLPLLTRDTISPDAMRVFDLVAGKDRNTPPVGPGATYMYSPGVAEPMQQLNQYLRKSVVGARFFEICALLGARDQDQAYEWSSHELGARRAGVEQATIDAIKFNLETQGLPEKDALVIQFGRALLRQHRVSPAMYAKVVEQFGRQGMIELTAIIGDYVLAAIMLNAVDQQLPPDRQPLLPVK